MLCSNPCFILLKFYQCRVDKVNFLWLFVIIIHVAYAFAVICSYIDYIEQFQRNVSISCFENLNRLLMLDQFLRETVKLKDLNLTLAKLSLFYSTLFKDVASTRPLFLS